MSIQDLKLKDLCDMLNDYKFYDTSFIENLELSDKKIIDTEHIYSYDDTHILVLYSISNKSKMWKLEKRCIHCGEAVFNCLHKQ